MQQRIESMIASVILLLRIELIMISKLKFNYFLFPLLSFNPALETRNVLNFHIFGAFIVV